MSIELLRRMRAAREITIPLEDFPGKTVTIRRPTDLAFARAHQTNKPMYDMVREHAVNWSGFTEIDLVPGGNDGEVKFSQEVFWEWFEMSRPVWQPLLDALMQAVLDKLEQKAEAEKNSENTSTQP